MTVKLLERLIGKLQSMHFTMPGTLEKFYAMQVSLTSNLTSNHCTAHLSA